MTKLIFDDVNFSDYYYYDETSPTCLRWRANIITRSGRRTKAQTGRVAGGVVKASGYCQTRLMQKTYQVHRIIYELVHGSVPEGYDIDHIDRNRGNNRISNLRATDLNNRNKSMQTRNKSGVCGVRKEQNGWLANWKKLDGKNGTKYFSSLKHGNDQAFLLAVQARDAAIRDLNLQGAGYTETHGRQG